MKLARSEIKRIAVQNVGALIEHVEGLYQQVRTLELQLDMGRDDIARGRALQERAEKAEYNLSLAQEHMATVRACREKAEADALGAVKSLVRATLAFTQAQASLAESRKAWSAITVKLQTISVRANTYGPEFPATYADALWSLAREAEAALEKTSGEAKNDRCPCGGIILADTEEWPTPLCYDCYTQIGVPKNATPNPTGPGGDGVQREADRPDGG